ncbi:MAG: organomercurial lyase MerB [Ktedonobacteraceae bacterium]
MKKHTRLARIACHVTLQLDCMQEPVCRQMLHALADIGQPLSPAHLATLLQMNQEELRKHLARVSDTEFDEQGNIVGWGVTLVPTAHHIQLHGRPLYTWCAFDTVLFPALLQTEAQLQSVCATTGRPITFLVTRQGIQKLTPATSVLSLILPRQRCDCVRGTFCEQSLFFHSAEAASSWLALHPDALLLSLEEAALVGQTVTKMGPQQSIL